MFDFANSGSVLLHVHRSSHPPFRMRWNGFYASHLPLQHPLRV
jgi:hypothetical protein